MAKMMVSATLAATCPNLFHFSLEINLRGNEPAIIIATIKM
jgi:hypothetical protein